ncbi:MAG: GDSL-type esterase/lipase family protein [Lachnospiraceae bacterium]|nr:GDSL-type esterase/lipase family protein [Lachnospiraceae bacterium]
MYRQTYVFRPGEDDIHVSASLLNQEEVDFGLLPFSDSVGKESGMDGEKKRNYPAFDRCILGYPVRFFAGVPHKGVYRVTVGLSGGKQGVRNLNLYTGRRNLIRRDMEIKAGETRSVTFYSHVCEYLPVVGEPARLDGNIRLNLLGDAQNLAECLLSVIIEETDVPTVFIAGDSLVADYETEYPYNPLTSFGSWGQNLPQYFDGLAFCNQAHGGLTTNCFRQDGHWDIVRDNIKPGDVFMLQFGHNDQKRRNLKAYVQYAANLCWYISEVRERGAYPVIVTSMSRVPSQDEDGWFDLLKEYEDSCLRVGQECHVPVINLHDYSFRLFCEKGIDWCQDYFMDMTHTNDYGALLMTEFIAGELVRLSVEPFASHRNTYSGEPWIPDQSLRPQNAVSSVKKEERPVLPHDLPKLPYADCQGIRQEQKLKEAMWKGLLDPCVKFFHPFDDLPRGQFLYLFFKAMPDRVRKPWSAAYCDVYRYEWDAGNIQAAFDSGLIDETTTPDRHFRPDDPLTCAEFVSFMVRSLHPVEEREISMEDCEREAKKLGLLWDGYMADQPVGRADCAAALVDLMEIAQKSPSS